MIGYIHASDPSIGLQKMGFQNITSISSFSVQDIPSPFVSTFNGPSAVTSIDGSGAYLQQNDHFFELSCSTSKCSWSLMDQKLDVGRDGAVLMYLPADYECWFYTNKSSLTLTLKLFPL